MLSIVKEVDSEDSAMHRLRGTAEILVMRLFARLELPVDENQASVSIWAGPPRVFANFSAHEATTLREPPVFPARSKSTCSAVLNLPPSFVRSVSPRSGSCTNHWIKPSVCQSRS